MPWTTVALAVLVGAAAVLEPSTWPTRIEVVRALGSLALLTAAVYAPSRGARLASAALWLALLLGTRVPLQPGQTAADFRTFYDAAQALFRDGRSPYTAPGATAFPFPTFPLVHLISLGGRVGLDHAYLIFTALQAALLGLILAVSVRLEAREAGAPGRDPAARVLLAALVVQPPILAGLAWGNSGAVAGAGMTLALWAWLAGRSRVSCHAGAACLALACMVKPQLLMAAGFFLVSAVGELRPGGGARSRAAAIGRLVLPWAAAFVVLSLPLAPPASIQAYPDFLQVARRWHTEVAETHSNNLALAALLAKGMARLPGIPIAQSLPLLTAAMAGLVLAGNLRSLAAGPRDMAAAALPWLLGSLLWTSLVWDWYLTLALAAPLLLVGRAARRPPAPPARGVVLWSGIACCTTASPSLVPLGILLLYLHALGERDRDAPAETRARPARCDGTRAPGTTT